MLFSMGAFNVFQKGLILQSMTALNFILNQENLKWPDRV